MRNVGVVEPERQEKVMRTSVAVVLIAGLAGISSVSAQSGAIPSPNLTTPPPQGQTFPQAPVGHRQPRAGDIPSERNQSENSQAAVDREDAALDRKIKGICRGC
jgi:hypothetical protein